MEDIYKEDYDFIILADVLEHLVNPFEFIHELSKNISAKTKIIISVPNIAFGAVRIALLNGNFDYVDWYC